MTDTLKAQMEALGLQAKAAAKAIANATTQQKNLALTAMAEAIDANRADILAANEEDLSRAKSNNLDPALLDRLALSDATIDGMIESLHQVAALPDPVGEIRELSPRPSGIQVGRMRVPLGVIGIIYESRPNVTTEAASLCLKSGNAAILRGGSEAKSSNQAIAKCVAKGLESAGLPKEAVQLIPTTDREAVGHLITASQTVDVIVPRGGKGLIERISNEATIPVIKHLNGICHVYIDGDADMEKAIAIALNAKTQRYGTCNTMETLLIAGSVAQDALEQLVPLYREKGVELRGCDTTCKLVSGIIPATEEDWETEYLAPILSIRVVKDMQAAIDHIHQYGSGHTESIVSQDYSKSMQFLRQVDSSSVMVNASTRFADGFEYGLGAEIGISTNKLHARGPVGLEGLTIEKFVVLGDGHIRG